MLHYEYWRKKEITFIYPAVLIPHKNDKGYHVTSPDLRCCKVDGPGLEGAMEHARKAAHSWLYLEIEEKTLEFPPQTHVENIRPEEEEFLKQIVVTVRLLPDNS